MACNKKGSCNLDFQVCSKLELCKVCSTAELGKAVAYSNLAWCKLQENNSLGWYNLRPG